MNDDVWKSKLLKWLRRRGELDLLPWKEFVLFRVARDQQDLGWRKNQVIAPVPIGKDDETDESDPFSILLPTKPQNDDKKNSREAEPKDSLRSGLPKYPVKKFNLHTWKAHILCLEKAKITWEKRVGEEIPASEYNETDDEWMGSTTTSEGRCEWGGWVCIQLHRFLQKMAADKGYRKREAKIHHLRFSKGNADITPATFQYPDLFERARRTDASGGSVIVQMRNHVIFLGF